MLSREFYLQNTLVKHWNHSLQSSIVRLYLMPCLLNKWEIVHCLQYFRDSSINQKLDNGRAYLHQSLPHWRCHGNHCHCCAECSSPSRRCSWPILESGGGAARASPDPNTHMPEPWGAHCRNANFASDTSDNSQPSTAELWKKWVRGLKQSPNPDNEYYHKGWMIFGGWGNVSTIFL